jgi:ABC-type transporter Mla MlaB component
MANDLRYFIDGRTAQLTCADSGRLIVRGELTRDSVTRLAERLEATGARPQVIDARAVRFADLPALTALVRWLRRAGLPAVQIDDPPAPLAAMIERCRLGHLLVVGRARAVVGVAA